jgi:acetoin utilization protein AcuB
VVISDVMNSNVVSIPSTTSLAEARRIMNAHNIRRLPVIDRAVLLGIVTKDDLDKMGPSKLTTFSVNELVYLLNKITVKDVMHTDVVTVPPDATIEEVVATAQARKIGSVVVVEGGRVIGIATTNDIFLGILNPLLGIGKKGSRICVVNCSSGPDIEKVLAIINAKNIAITNLFISDFPKAQKRDLIVHLDEPDGANIVAQDIRKLGFMVVERKR